MIDLTSVWLTLALALITAALLMVVSVPLAWWLSQTRRGIKPVIEAVTALPLVLPPTVLGFYLLILFSPEAPIGGAWLAVTGETLSFSFAGLVIASMIYSLPFAVQPLQTAFEALPRAALDSALTLGARPLDRFRTVILPLARRGVLTAFVLSFAHTIGEFGVVLMVGGNIPGRTRVISIEVFSAVETIDYRTAHILSGGLLIFSLLILTAIYVLNRTRPHRVG